MNDNVNYSLWCGYFACFIFQTLTEGGEQQAEQPAGEGEEQQAEEPAGESGEQQAEGGEAAAEGAEQQAEQPPAEGGNVSAPMKIVYLFVLLYQVFLDAACKCRLVFSFVLFLFVCLFVVVIRYMLATSDKFTFCLTSATDTW